MSALLSLVFVVNAVLVGTKLLRLDKVSECVRCLRQRRQGVLVSCGNHEESSRVVSSCLALRSLVKYHCKFIVAPRVNEGRVCVSVVIVEITKSVLNLCSCLELRSPDVDRECTV